ncbi:MAG: GAF domain-containing protein [Chloroflexi bacterium]|nr:GAF domain-containing protein [Chloroflexota bacterium]
MGLFTWVGSRLGRRLGLWLIGLVMLAVVVPSGIVAALAVSTSRGALEHEILSDHLAAAELAAELARRYMEAVQGNVDELAGRDRVIQAITTGQPEAAAYTLVRFQQNNPRLDGINLVDLNGVSRVSGRAGNANTGISYADREWFQRVLATGRPYLGLPVESRGTGNAVIPYAVPVVDYGGDVRGVLVAGISVSELSDALTDARLGSEARFRLIDRREGGTILAHSDPQWVGQPITVRSEPTLRALAGERGTAEAADPSGRRFLWAFTPVRTLPWAVILDEPSEVSLAPVLALTQRMLALIWIALVVAAILAGWLTHRIIRPLGRLQQAANAFAAGDWKQRVGLDRSDELGDVGRAFDHLADSLQNQTAQARVAIEELRGQVAERKRAELERSRLLVLEQRARAEAEALAALSASVAGSLDPAETLSLATAALPRLLDAQVFSVLLPGSDGLLWSEAVAGAESEFLRRHPIRPGVGYIGRAFSEGRPQRTNDIVGDPRSIHAQLDGQLGVRAFLAVPLIAHGRTLGVIAAGSARPGAFAEHHEGLLDRIAQPVANALMAAQLRAETRREEAEKAAILEQMASAVLVTDRDGRIVLANRAAGTLVGLSPAQMLGLAPTAQPWRTFDPDGTELAPTNDSIARTLLGQTPPSELRIVAVDGQENWVSVSSAALTNESGATYGAVLVMRDVTDERRRQRQAAAGEKLRALGQMASGVAHDLNQYLTMVSGYGDLTLQTLERTSPDLESVRESTEIMIRAARDGAETVKRLLTFSRPTPEGPSQRVDLGELLREVSKLTSPHWRDATQREGRPIDLTVEVTGEPVVDGWPASLREAFMNLVFNAVEAMPNGGSIRLTARERGDIVEAEVVDSGIGMSAAVQAHVFEPFFSTKGERGTGLGLAMVFGIVERHEGQIGLQSAPGRGTALRMTFPAAKAAPVEAAPVTPATAHRTLRILAVDDEPLLSSILSRLLCLDGHTVTLASSGEEAQQRLGTQPFDLVISDLGLGAGMNGWELAEHVRSSFPGTHFILATGWGAQIDAEEAKSRGVEAVVAKPYRFNDLKAVVATM